MEKFGCDKAIAMLKSGQAVATQSMLDFNTYYTIVDNKLMYNYFSKDDERWECHEHHLDSQDLLDETWALVNIGEFK